MVSAYSQMFMPTPPITQNTLAPALYVGDLDENVTEEMLHEYFIKYGPIFYLKIARDVETKKSKGFAYINFYNPRDGNFLFCISH